MATASNGPSCTASANSNVLPANHGTNAVSRAQAMGGYDADFVLPVQADYLCPICQLAFRDPIQTRDCGHRFCESCIEPILRKPPAFCPIDRRPLSREKVYPDRACKRTVLSLAVRCHNFGNECEWEGDIINLATHVENCRKVPVKCVNSCGRTDIPRDQMQAHVEVEGDCPLAVVPCHYLDVGCKFKAKKK